jgi:hypothetical protein
LSLNDISDEDLRRYLLGTLPQPARVALEERYLSDDGVYERLLVIEEELIDHQALGLLSSSQWASLRGTLRASADGPERLSFAQALAQLRLQRRQSFPRRFPDVLRQWSHRRVFVPSAIGAVVLLVCATVWRDFHSQDVRLEPRSDRTAPPTATLFLRSISRDTSAGNILKIPGGHAHVLLEAEFPGDERKTYQATIRRVDDDRAQIAANIRKQTIQTGAVLISADFSSDLFKDGDYILTIFLENGGHSPEEIIAYTLSVVRTPPL